MGRGRARSDRRNAVTGVTLDAPRSRLSPRVRRGALYRVPYCVPFWGPGTYAALLRCVLTGRVVAGPDIGRLVDDLRALLGVTLVLPCGTGKAALETALRACGVGAGDEVLVPTLCCPDVLAPVLAIRAAPVLTDIGPDLNVTAGIIEGAIGPRTRAVVVPHLFGNPADVSAIVAIAAPRGIAVIDDAAQALGAESGGRPVGTLGHAGIGSFGNGKVCFGTAGGFLVTGDPAIFDRAARLPLATASARATLRRATTILVGRRWRRWTYPLRRLLTPARQGHTSGEPSYVVERMRNLDAAVARTLLATLEANLRGRRERVGWYREHLADAPGIAVISHAPGSACTKQIVMLGELGDAGLAERAAATLGAAGYEVAPAYLPLHLRERYRGFARRALPAAEAVGGRLLELPTEPSVARADIERICALLRDTMR